MSQPANPVVALETSHGLIRVELFQAEAPISVRNFLDYLASGHYEGTVFHRVIPGFMIQGGGFTASMQQKRAAAPIRNEAGNGLKNDRGTLALARTQAVDSATCQFFINLKNNDFLNHRDTTAQGFGYAVFGRVIEGMDVVDAIARVPTGRHGMHENVPTDPVVVRASRLES